MSSLIHSLPEDSWQAFWQQYGSNVITDTLLCSFPKAIFPITEQSTSHHTRSDDFSRSKSRRITPVVTTQGVPTIKRELIWN